jgi:hypothetical protein
VRRQQLRVIGGFLRCCYCYIRVAPEPEGRQVANSSGKAVSIIELYFVGRDGTGAVTFVNEGFADLSSLPPGGTSPFTIDIFSMPDPAPTKYQVIAQASPQ